MKPISDFYSRIQPFVIGCPEPAIAQALVDAAIAFCEDTEVLRVRLDSFQTAKGESQYRLDPPDAQHRVNWLHAVRIAGERHVIDIVSREETPADDALAGKPMQAYSSYDGAQFVVNLFPAPDSTYDLVPEVSLRPKRGATMLADELFEKWVDAVVAGTLSRLLAIPNQPYTDPARALEAGTVFVALAQKARREARTGPGKSSMRVRQRPLA